MKTLRGISCAIGTLVLGLGLSACGSNENIWPSLVGQTANVIADDYEDFLHEREATMRILDVSVLFDKPATNLVGDEYLNPEWTILGICADGPNWEKSHEMKIAVAPSSVITEDVRTKITAGDYIDSMACVPDEADYRYFSSPDSPRQSGEQSG